MARVGFTGFGARSSLIDLSIATIPAGLSYETTIFRTGDTSLKATATSATNNAGGTLPDTTGPFFRIYVRVTARPATTARIIVGTTASVNIRLNPNGTLALYNTTTLIGTSTTALTTTTTWYRVEFRIGTGTSVPVLLIDGATEVTGSPSSWAFSGSVGPADTVADTYTVYFADWSTDGAGFPGNGSVIHVVPTGTISVGSGWQKPGGATTNLQTSVDNRPPVGVADSTSSAQAENQIRNASTLSLSELSSPSLQSLGIAATDTIAVIDYWATGAPVSTGAKTGAVTFQGTGFTGSATTTNGQFWSGVAAGTYPTGWKVMRSGANALTITDITQTTKFGFIDDSGTASRIAIVAAIGAYIDVAPAGVTHYTMAAATGTFAETGQAAGLRTAHKLPVSVATFTETGTATGLRIARKIPAAVSAFTLTGQATGLRATRTIPTSVGVFIETGQATGLRRGYQMAAALASFSLTGTAAPLRTVRTLGASVGAFTLTGIAPALRAERRTAAAVASFTLTGSATGLTVIRRLSVTAGVYVLSGQATGLKAARQLAGGTGVYVLTGNAATLTKTGLGPRVLTADTGNFFITGTAASLRTVRRVSASPASFLLTGNAATLTRTRLPLTADSAAFTMTANPSVLLATRRLSAGSGSFVLTGLDVLLTALTAEDAVMALTGIPVLGPKLTGMILVEPEVTGILVAAPKLTDMVLLGVELLSGVVVVITRLSAVPTAYPLVGVLT